MQLSVSCLPSGVRPPCPSRIGLAGLWLEQERPDEIRQVEELKRKQKALEREVAERRRKQQEQREQAATPVHE